LNYFNQKTIDEGSEESGKLRKQKHNKKGGQTENSLISVHPHQRLHFQWDTSVDKLKEIYSIEMANQELMLKFNNLFQNFVELVEENKKLKCEHSILKNENNSLKRE